MAKAFHGRIEDTTDALIIFEACRKGLLPKINRRLLAAERGEVQDDMTTRSEDPTSSAPQLYTSTTEPSASTPLPLETSQSTTLESPSEMANPQGPSLITPGSVFVFDEEQSKICRWTDGRIWSPSRICGNFLVYRELYRKLPTEKCWTPKEKAKMKDGSGLKDKALKEKVERDNLVVMGCMKGTFVLKKDGLIKKTMCVRGIELPSKDDLISGAFQGKEGRTNKQGSNAPLPCFSEAGIQHLVCYEQAGAMEDKNTPRQYDELLNLELSSSFINIQKFRNPMRVLPLPHGTEPLDPFDEYVNIDRIVEGRASEGDTASVKVPLTKSKRKRSGRSKCKENDDGEDFDTSDDDDPSHDDFTGDPGPSTKLSKLKNIQRHSHQIRGQGRQTNRNPSSSQLTSKSQRAPSIRKNPTRGASKKHAVQGQNGGYVLPFSGYQISGPANNERDYANGGGTQTNISIPQSSHYQPELEVNGVRTTDGQWHLLPNVPAPLHCDTSGYYPSQHDIAVRPDQPCGSNPLAPPEYSVVKMEDCINTESHGVKRRQDFEQSPHRDQGSYLQEVNDATTQQGGKEKRRRLGQHEIDQVGSVKSTILRSPVLRGSRNHGRPRGRRNGRLQSPSGMSSHNNISNSPLSSPITTSLTSDSLSSRDSLSSSYSLSLMTETEGPGEDGSLHADIPSNADDANPECKREQESDLPLYSTGDERLETRGEDGDGSSSFSSYHPSLSSTQSSPPSEHLATNQVYEFQHDGIIPLQDSTESHIRFMSSNALQHNVPQTPQLETTSIGTHSGLCPPESPSQPISASGSIYSAATTLPVIGVVYPLPVLDVNSQDRASSTPDAMEGACIPQGAYCTDPTRVEPLLQKSRHLTPNSMQLGDSSELSFDINLVKALQQSYEVQAVEQDSSSSASFSGSAQSNTLSCNDTVIYQTQMDMSLGINEFTHHTLDHGSQTAANHLPTFPVGLQAEDPKQTHQFWTSSRALPMWLQDSGASPTTDSWQLKQKRCRPQFMSPSSYLFPDKVRYSTEHQPYQASSDISKHYHSLTEGLSNANADNESNITSTDNNQSPLCTLQHGASFYLETMAYIGSQPLYFDSQNPDTTIGSDCSDSPRDQVDCLEVNSEHDERLTQVEPCVPGQPISIYNPTPRTLAVAQPMVSYDEDLSFEEHDIDNLRSSDTLGSDEYLLHMQHPQSLQLMHHHDEQSPRRNNMGPSHDDLPSAMCREEDTTQDVMNFLSELPPRSMYEPASSDTQPFSDPPDHHVFADEEEILLH